jgi:bifunctional non-homologous end joining protein LigD
MSLETYRSKRDFTATPEPSGGPDAGGGRLYVIQKHAASRLHYDFRLELDGVLLSWAVPKGPSLDPRDRHLAVRVEDHPVEYGGFEGTIPRGEYGGGTVALWDRGTWEPEGDPHAGLAKGDLKFTLHGEKLKGSWVLVRMKRRSEAEGKENWLLIKHRDPYATDGNGAAILAERPESVASGRTIDEVAADEATGSTAETSGGPRTGETPPNPSAVPGARPAASLPRFVQPELAKLVASAPTGDEWLHEIKYDGYRALSRIEGGRVEMYSRNEHDWTERWQPIADELARLPVSSAIVDGEVVVELEGGRTDFGALQTDLGAGRTDRLRYYVFDLLHLDGYDLTGVPLKERKSLLHDVLEATAPRDRLRYADDVPGDGAAVLASACTLALEGIVSKKADAGYRPGQRGPGWLKTKCLKRQEFVIVGWTPPSGTRVGFGALLLAVTDPDGALRYIGKVGTGFSDRFLADFGERLRAITAPGPSVERGAERAPRNARWVEPRFVGEVAFAEWTSEGTIRHQTFQGLREDKSPADVVMEAPLLWADAENKVTLTHPERVFWPETGTTKQDLADFYAWIAPFMLPYVTGRPVSMVRCPAGVGPVSAGRRIAGGPGQCFFHKHPGHDFPGPFERVEIVESQGPGLYLTITGAESLTALAQMGVLEVHVWGATWPEIERPDFMVFDLDPSDEVGWPELVAGARLVRDVLGGLGLTSFVKTTGGKGLHVCVPIEPTVDWETAKGFAKAVADAIAAYAPDRYVSTMSKAKRVGRVYIDYLRTSRAATFIAPYSTRARTRPTVSVPLRWDELGGRIRPDTYDLGNVRRRLAHLPGDPWEGFFDLRQSITPKMRSEIGAA